MVQQNNMEQSAMPTENIALQFGGPELINVDASMGALVEAIEHLNLSLAQIQDKQLSGIATRQRDYMMNIYHVILETLQTAAEPSNKINDYNMVFEHPKTSFGLTQKPPKKPIQQATELTDECISSSILSHLKGIAVSFTTTSLEATNPVLRRVFADAIPNIIEMAYEAFLYQNQKSYYEVPQYSGADMLMILNSYGKIANPPSH